MKDMVQPFRPSRLNMWTKSWSGVDPSIPTTRNTGVEVSAWTRVLASVHPSDPDISAVPALFQATVRVWRLREETREGTAEGQGQWFAGEELSFALDGDVANNGPMEYHLDTRQSERMYLQLISVSNEPVSWSITGTITGVRRRVEETDDCCPDTPGATGWSSGGFPPPPQLITLIDNTSVTTALDVELPDADGEAMATWWKDVSIHIYAIGGKDAEIDRTVTVTMYASNGIVVGASRHFEDIDLSGFVLDEDQTIRELVETSLITSTGDTPASRIIKFDELNVGYFKLHVQWSGAPSTTPGRITIIIRKKAH